MMGYGTARNRVLQPTALVIAVTTFLLIPICLAQLDFIWDVEPWSPCEHASCGPGGRQYRKVWCKLMTGQPVVDFNCEQDFKPAQERQCEKPCVENVNLEQTSVNSFETTLDTHTSDFSPSDRLERSRSRESQGLGDTESSRGGFRQTYPLSQAASDVEWVVDQWSSCSLVPGADSCGRNSGVQYRNVTCERKDRQDRVKAYRCEVEEPMPATSQSCELLCRQDCVVSTFSHWSICDSSCQSANQTRTRNVIVPPRHRGSHCPDLSEMTVCDKCTHSYTYKLSDWLPCSPIVASYLKDIKSHHLIGYQIRDISCLNTRGMMSSLSFCAKKFPNTVLRKHRSCVMSQDCQVSAWSSMHPHNTSCIGYDGQIKHGYMIRTRQIIQMPLGDGEPCPSAIIDYVKLSKEDSSLLRPCNRGKWILSSWSLCQSVPGYNHCGTGVRTRRAICVEAGDDGTERPVDDAHCPVPKPVVAQSCTMECNWDCSVSQWSTWTTCQETNCDRSDMVKRETSRPLGKRFRTREVLTLPGPAGAACPHLSETQACDPEQCYIWNITLGPCEATTRGGCGDGTQLRKAICLNKSGEKVRDRFCHESLHTEQNWANCYVPCPEDCVLSEWGHWSSCPDACLMQDGTRSRQRHILAYHSPGRRNRQCPTTGALIQTEPCPVLTDCSTYKWDVSTWGPCQLNIQNARIQCGPGTQTRAIECYTTMGVKAPDKCEESTQPRTSQPCSIDCPIDCHVTEWSDWSGCGIECLPAEARQMYPTQIRRRFILQYPQNGGLTCPSDLREEQPCTNLPVCQTHYYETTDWSDCILPPVVPLCGQGLRARNISCYQNDDKGTRQVPVMTCLEKLGSMPDTTEVCYIPCESECQFSSWSQWTLCGPQCEKNRFRIRRLLDESKNTPKCHDIELYPRDEHQECVCDSVQSVLIGGWSDCIIQSNLGDEMIFASMSLKSISARHRRTNETGVTGLGPQTYCGQGKRYMAFLCQNSYPNTAGTPVCTGEDYQEENCTVPCPVDCKTSPWSTWSQCSSACGAGVQKRERQIVAMPQNGGRRCPFLYGQKEMQTKVCHVECNQNVWKTEDWDPCIPSESRTCGDGTHRRIVRCIALSSEGTEIMTVDETFCNSHNKPQAIKPCSLPCPGECVLSEWSDWTTCTQPCTGKETQTRIRNVLRMPASYAVTQTCVPQTEERLCEKWKNCFEYSWEFSDWTSCLINYGEAECGVGHKERFAFCRNENGEKVDSIICQEIFGHVTEPMVVSCEIPCDNDCLLSDWSDWTACSTTCGLGFTKRRRTILQNPIGSGRKCPEKLDQSKPCFRKGCYRWFVSEWSQCILQQGACGSGEQERNISCLNDEGRLVVPSLCDIDPEILIMQTSRPCHVPCPGECKLSEWSSWSDCFISCEDYDQGFTVGIQARSRAVLAYPSSNNPPCDGTLWEDKACQAEYCSQFQWVTSEWDKITRSREVYCSRNDALVVVGGCDDSRIPSRKLTCTNPVCVTPAICEDLNECGCPPGEGHELQPISDTAVTCIMNTSAAHDLAAAGIQIAKSPNIWMYAVIAIGTLFVIAVTAALYNMCELFRTGPRPRRKGQHSHEGSTTGVLDSINGLQARTNTDQNMESPRSENIYKQLNHVPPETAHVFMETVISSSPAPGPHPNIRPPLSDDPEDIPGLETPASSLNNVSASAATISTPITPTDTDMKRSRAVGVMSQVGFVTSNHSDHLSTLPPRHNRRYKHIRYLLPAGLVKCFACNDNSSTCMLDEQHDQSHATRVSANEGQLIPLTQADSSTVGETCREEVGTSNSSAFLSHNCLLPHSHDLRPTKLDILKHDRVLDDSRMTDQLHIPLIDEIDSEIKRISPEMPKLFPASSSISHDSPRVPSQSGRDSLSELQLVPSTVTPDKYDVRSQGKMTVGHPNKSSEYAAQSLQYHRPKNFTPSPKSAPPLSLWSQSGKRLQLPAEASTISPSPSSLSPLLDLQYTNKASLTNRYNMHDPTNPRASGMELANVGDLPPAPSRIPVFPHFAQPVDVYTCSLCAQSHQKTSPIVHPNRHSRTDLLSPSSYSSDSGYNFNRKYESPSKSASYHNRLTTVKALISPIYRGKSEHGKGGDRTNLDAASKISSSTSLPENLITSTRNYSTIPPLIQKISQDSGHSTTPRSQTTSLDDYSLENPTDTVSRQSRRSGLYPFHGQASLESGHSSPASGLCDSCKRDLEKSKVLPFLLGASDSTSQASNICGMETSV